MSFRNPDDVLPQLEQAKAVFVAKPNDATCMFRTRYERSTIGERTVRVFFCRYMRVREIQTGCGSVPVCRFLFLCQAYTSREYTCVDFKFVAKRIQLRESKYACVDFVFIAKRCSI